MMRQPSYYVRPTMRFLYIGVALLLPTTLFAQVKQPEKRADVFGPDKLWTIHLKLGAKEYADMNPKGGGFGFGLPFGKKEEPKKEEKKGEPADTHKNKAFGIEFPWVKGDLEFEGKLVREVGIRYKGNSTYQLSNQGLKRPFKIDINHFREEQRLHGMGGFALGNGAADGTRIKEALAFHVFRAAKVPASRTAFVKLHLSVPEKHDNTYVGVYTLIEPIDKPFLKEHFGNDKGMLLKPEKIQGLQYLGEKWEAYQVKYNPKRETSEAQQRRLIEFTKLVNLADDDKFRKEIGKYLDVDGFLRFAAANSLITNLDSFFGLGHNYYLYLHPKTNKFHFIPWDLDLSFGGMSFGGPEQIDWNIAKPYMGKNRLTERVLAMKEHDEAYRRHLKTLAEGAFSPKAMRTQIDIVQAAIKDAVAKEPAMKGGGPFAMAFPGTKKMDLAEYIAKRGDSVLAQLEGKKQGKDIAGFGMFFGPPGGKGFGGFGPGNGLAKPIFEVADTNKDGKMSLEEFKVAASKLFKEAGGDDKKPVAEAELIDTINRLMPVPKGFGDFKFPAPPKGFGPGRPFAQAIMKQGGAGADKKLTREQFLTGAEKWFQKYDKDKSGSLDEKELIEGINQSMPPPEFGVPPGFGPGPALPKTDPPAKDKAKEKSL